MKGLFRVHLPVASLTLLVSDVLLTLTSFVLALYLHMAVDPWVYLIDDYGLLRLVPMVLSILIGMYFSGLYSDIQVRSGLILLKQLCLVMGSALLVQGLISYVLIRWRVPFNSVLLGILLSMATLFCWRLLFSSLASRWWRGIASERYTLGLYRE